MARQRAGGMKVSTERMEKDTQHHLTSPFEPQTPLSSQTSTPRSMSPVAIPKTVSPWLRWAVVPSASLKVLAFPIIMYINWEIFTPYLSSGAPNPFGHFFLISYRVPSSAPDDPRYQKSYYDLLFVAYYVVFFSLVRQVTTNIIFKHIGKYFGLRKPAKLERFGEQGHALVYFGATSVWGIWIMRQLPTFWYKTENFWIGYPHWQMIPDLKRYYLMQASHWIQELIVLVLGLEKPRKDYAEFVAHHIVTLWLIGWSYLVNMTPMGNAVYLSMDLPDAALAFSKLMNYLQWNTAKTISFAIFTMLWTYFRHYLNIMMIISTYNEFDLIPEESKQWLPESGAWLAGWMRWQIFIPMFALHCLNLFWYYFIWRILIRAVVTKVVDDERSDDEDDEPEKEE